MELTRNDHSKLSQAGGCLLVGTTTACQKGTWLRQEEPYSYSKGAGVRQVGNIPVGSSS